MASNMGSNVALQIETAIASAATNIRSSRLLRGGATAALALIAIALGTVTLPAQQPQISDFIPGTGWNAAERNVSADDIPQAR